MAAPRRLANKQEIEDAFATFSCSDQEQVLDALTQIHRILKRERERQPAPTPSVDMLNGIRAALKAANPAHNAALLLDAQYGEHEQ